MLTYSMILYANLLKADEHPEAEVCSMVLKTDDVKAYVQQIIGVDLSLIQPEL